MKNSYLLISIVLCLSGCASSLKTNKSESKVDPPKLLKPVVKKIWIPPEIRNGGAEWVEGHYMYRIEKEISWSR